jgi:hypothetical protein
MRAKDETTARNILAPNRCIIGLNEGEPEALDVRLSHGHTQPLRLIFSLLCAPHSFRQLRKKITGKSNFSPTYLSS